MSRVSQSCIEGIVTLRLAVIAFRVSTLYIRYKLSCFSDVAFALTLHFVLVACEQFASALGIEKTVS